MIRPTCTAEACSFRDNYQSLLGKGFEVIGVSTDNEKSHKKFEKKYSLPFPLIADPDRKIVEHMAFGWKKLCTEKIYGYSAHNFYY